MGRQLITFDKIKGEHFYPPIIIELDEILAKYLRNEISSFEMLQKIQKYPSHIRATLGLLQKFRENNKDSEGSYVYSILFNNNLVKIGMTTNISKRVAQLISCNSGIIEKVIYFKVTNKKIYEKELHEQFKDKNTHGEFFDITLDDVILYMGKFKLEAIEYDF